MDFVSLASNKKKKNKKKFRTVDIINKPVKKKWSIHCYFSSWLNFGFCGKYIEGDNVNKVRFCTAFQCYYCSNYYDRKDKYDRDIENCTGQPGIIYNFNTQNLITFENDFKYNGDIPLVAYIDFETTAPTDDSLDPESTKLCSACYVIIFAFHRKLQLRKVIIKRSFGHSERQLKLLNIWTIKF